MKSTTDYLTITTETTHQFINISSDINRILIKSGIKEGLCLVNSMHITSSVFINDEESGLKADFLEWLNKLAPQDSLYQHNLTGEDNGYAHLWRTVMGREVVVAVTKGRLDFGPWEQIFYGEFDGKRPKKVLIKIIGE
jgi:secondary thiamine-phosphate synthase enzyme